MSLADKVRAELIAELGEIANRHHADLKVSVDVISFKCLDGSVVDCGVPAVIDDGNPAFLANWRGSNVLVVRKDDPEGQVDVVFYGRADDHVGDGLPMPCARMVVQRHARLGPHTILGYDPGERADEAYAILLAAKTRDA